DNDIISFLFLMVVAGNETTAKLLANAWYLAWRNPGERAKPFADPSRIEAWIEETLRYDTSTQMLARSATEEVDLHGGRIPAGDRGDEMTTATLREPPLVSGGDTDGSHLEELRRDPIGLMRRVREECGDVGEFRLADRPVVLLTGAGANEVFFRAAEDELD